jgi:hypothetical protein
MGLLLYLKCIHTAGRGGGSKEQECYKEFLFHIVAIDHSQITGIQSTQATTGSPLNNHKPMRLLSEKFIQWTIFNAAQSFRHAGSV